MDLLQTIRKEGSRGGRSEFSWQEVQNDPHRQNYLGHSLMAPVGRWQKGKDLNWYARGEGDDKEVDEAAQRREEMRMIKEREEDEMLKALGLPVPDRNNANLEPVAPREGMPKIGAEDEVEKKEVAKRRRSRSRSRERKHRRDDRSRSRDRKHHRRRSRSRDGERDRRHRSRREDGGRSHGREDEDRKHRHHHRDHTTRPRSAEHKRHRSRSPNERRDKDYERRRRHD